MRPFLSGRSYSLYRAATAMYRAATAFLSRCRLHRRFCPYSWSSSFDSCRRAPAAAFAGYIAAPSLDSRVQIRPFCPRRCPNRSSRVQIMGFCPRRRPLVLFRTAARARSAQGASQFAAVYAAVRLPHHSDVRLVQLTKTR